MGDLRFALLIDSDNVSAKYIDGILDEMTTHGITTYKRIYGDWTRSQAGKWRKKLLDKSITPIQQFSNTVGKNSTDSALIIDAMDILYSGNMDGFCIVSSDSDFTRLASRLRESGMMVIGMGEDKTPQSFRNACTIFTNLENLLDEDEEDSEEIEEKQEDKFDRFEKEEKFSPYDRYEKYEKFDKREINKTDFKKEEETKKKNGRKDQTKFGGYEIRTYTKNQQASKTGGKNKEGVIDAIIGIITENDNKDTGLAEVGNRLVKKYPDFDVRSFGYSSLTKFLESISDFQLERTDKSVNVYLKDDEKFKSNVIDHIYKMVDKNGANGIGINELSNDIRNIYKNFNIKKFGYSQMSKFIQSLDGIEVYENVNKTKWARRR